LDEPESQYPEQTEQHFCRLSRDRSGDRSRAVREIGNQGDHSAVQAEPELAFRVFVERTGFRKQVYDLKNCGPRQRFCVIDYDGMPRLVHNCTQAIARDCLVEAMKRVSRRYPEIVMHVHDEMIVEVPEGEAQEALTYMCECMAEPIPWAPGLLLKGDGYVTKFYRKD
jgi:hypothetical protein